MTLWTADEIATATGGQASGAFAVSGVAFDSRVVANGIGTAPPHPQHTWYCVTTYTTLSDVCVCA